MTEIIGIVAKKFDKTSDAFKNFCAGLFCRRATRRSRKMKCAFPSGWITWGDRTKEYWWNPLLEARRIKETITITLVRIKSNTCGCDQTCWSVWQRRVTNVKTYLRLNLCFFVHVCPLNSEVVFKIHGNGDVFIIEQRWIHVWKADILIYVMLSFLSKLTAES